MTSACKPRRPAVPLADLALCRACAVSRWSEGPSWVTVGHAADPDDLWKLHIESTLRSELVTNEMATLTRNPDGGDVGALSYRMLATERDQISRPDRGEDAPEYLVLGSDDEYDLYRLQRAFIFIELEKVPELRRGIAQKQLSDLIYQNSEEACFRIIEAVATGLDCLILELIMTCADEPGKFNQLNRRIAPELTKFKAPKYSLLVSSCDEQGWPSEDAAAITRTSVSPV